MLEYDEDNEHNYQYIVVEVDRAAAGLSRDEVMSVLRAENVLARRYFYPGCHRMAPYRFLYPEARRALPATESVLDRVLVLPNGAALGPEGIGTICQILRLAQSEPGRVRRRHTVHGPSLRLPAPHHAPIGQNALPIPN